MAPSFSENYMIQTTVCASLNQGLETLLTFTKPDHDPFAQDWIICPHPESAKWVSRRLAEERGLCAQVEIYPVGRWVSSLQGVIWPQMPSLPSPSRMTWATLEGAPFLSERLGPKHELTQLFGHPIERGDDHIGKRRSRRRSSPLAGRKLSAAQRFAKLLRRLLLSRPHWLQRWEVEGVTELIEEDIWPSLWCEVSKVLGPIDHQTSAFNSDRLAMWSDWLELLCRRAANPEAGLHQRIRKLIFFGHHRYDAQTLALARACAQSIEVGFITVDPIFYASRELRTPHPMETSEPLHQPAPLLLSYGGGFSAYKPLREDPHSESELSVDPLRPPPPFPITPPPPQTRSEQVLSSTTLPSLLNLLQRDLIEGTPRPVAPEVAHIRSNSTGEEYSLKFHSSYSDQRQIEDLYQCLMTAFRRDPSLRPRDILVLCPDIERFTPLILAVFNGDLSHSNASDASRDRGLLEPQRIGAEVARPHGQNPYSHLLTLLLKLATGRLYRHDVFQCLKHPLVATRFRLSLSEILKIEQWTRRSGIRWGLDAAHRVSCGLNEEAQHSWEFGLDRLLMGTLVGEELPGRFEELYGGVAPLSLGGEEPEELLSRFCDFFLTLKALIPRLSSHHTPAVWCELLIDTLRSMTHPSSTEERALRQDVESDLRRTLKRRAPTQQMMTNKAISVLIEGVGQQRSVIGAGRDHVRFYPLDQAYAVPAKVICFINFSEGRFPQRDRSDRLDPLSAAPLSTDLDPLQEQFSNVISSLLAAQEQVHFFYTGQKPSGETRLPAPLLQAIQEEISARYQIGGELGDQLISALTVKHPLHSFSPRNFLGDEHGNPTEETLSHEPIWLKGAQAWQAAMSDPQELPPFADRSLEVAARGVSRPKIDSLRQLLKNPCEYFLKRGVGMSLLRDEELTRERELLELDSLQSWQLRDRTFDLLMSMDPTLETTLNEEDEPTDNGQLNALDESSYLRAMAQVQAEGLLPIGRMGEVTFEQALEEVKSLYHRFSDTRQGERRQPIAINVQLPSGRPLSIESEHRFGHRLIFTTPSRHNETMVKGGEPSPRGDRLIEPWLYHVALSAADPHFEGTSLVAQDGLFDRFPPLNREKALSLLDHWVDLLEEGSLKPLRFDPDLSWKWLKLSTGEGGTEAAIAPFEDLASGWRKADDQYVKQTYGEQPLWRSTEREGEQRSAEQQVIHPQFIDQCDLIFGELAQSLREES